MKKIVFAAIIGYTGVQTFDGRVLEAPEPDRTGRRALLHRDYPLPVMAHHSGNVLQVGTIEMAAICDHRIIAFGHLDPHEEFEHIRRGLDLGTYLLEINVDWVRTAHQDNIIRLTEWRLTGANVGVAPVWKLPRMQVEIMNMKETSSA